jgi:hypothetical protein
MQGCTLRQRVQRRFSSGAKATGTKALSLDGRLTDHRGGQLYDLLMRMRAVEATWSSAAGQKLLRQPVAFPQ